jgi:phosphohistidine phosphatase
MELYVVRHGEAAPQAAGGDAARPLTSRGAAIVAAVGRGLREAGVGLDAIAASPRLRAQQTARLLADALGRPPVSTEAILDGSESAGVILDALPTFVVRGSRLAIVGHQPVLGELVMLAAAGRGTPGASLPPACVVRIEFVGAPHAGAGRIAWWAPPALLTGEID